MSPEIYSSRCSLLSWFYLAFRFSARLICQIFEVQLVKGANIGMRTGVDVAYGIAFVAYGARACARLDIQALRRYGFFLPAQRAVNHLLIDARLVYDQHGANLWNGIVRIGLRIELGGDSAPVLEALQDLFRLGDKSCNADLPAHQGGATHCGKSAVDGGIDIGRGVVDQIGQKALRGQGVFGCIAGIAASRDDRQDQRQRADESDRPQEIAPKYRARVSYAVILSDYTRQGALF